MKASAFNKVAAFVAEVVNDPTSWRRIDKLSAFPRNTLVAVHQETDEPWDYSKMVPEHPERAALRPQVIVSMKSGQ